MFHIKLSPKKSNGPKLYETEKKTSKKDKIVQKYQILTEEESLLFDTLTKKTFWDFRIVNSLKLELKLTNWMQSMTRGGVFYLILHIM